MKEYVFLINKDISLSEYGSSLHTALHRLGEWVESQSSKKLPGCFGMTIDLVTIRNHMHKYERKTIHNFSEVPKWEYGLCACGSRTRTKPINTLTDKQGG